MPDSAIEHGSIWRSREIKQAEGDWRYQLNPQDLAELEAAVQRVQSLDLALEEVTRADFELPVLQQEIARWREQIENGPGFVVVGGLPVGEWSKEQIEIAFWGIGHQLGLPGGQNPHQELLGHVTDYQEAADNPSVRLYRTAANIDFHCDAADVVGLLCLQPAKQGGQSRIASTGVLFNEVLSRDRQLARHLFEPFKLDSRGESRPGAIAYSEIVPCAFAHGRLATFYHSEYFRSVERLEGGSIEPAHRAILDSYDEVAADPDVHLDMWLQAGDMQFLSNHTLAHARTAYEDFPDPDKRRHLLRLWLSLQ